MCRLCAYCHIIFLNPTSSRSTFNGKSMKGRQKKIRLTNMDALISRVVYPTGQPKYQTRKVSAQPNATSTRPNKSSDEQGRMKTNQCTNKEIRTCYSRKYTLDSNFPWDKDCMVQTWWMWKSLKFRGHSPSGEPRKSFVLCDWYFACSSLIFASHML